MRRGRNGGACGAACRPRPWLPDSCLLRAVTIVTRAARRRPQARRPKSRRRRSALMSNRGASRRRRCLTSRRVLAPIVLLVNYRDRRPAKRAARRSCACTRARRSRRPSPSSSWTEKKASPYGGTVRAASIWTGPRSVDCARTTKSSTTRTSRTTSTGSWTTSWPGRSGASTTRRCRRRPSLIPRAAPTAARPI